MATITRSPVTPEDLLSIADRPMPELVDGELLERDMGLQAEKIVAMLLSDLVVFVKEHRLGDVYASQAGYQIFTDDPNKVRIPDGSFIPRERLPSTPITGHSRVVPDLVFEVISPNDLWESSEGKVNDFLAAGVRLVWVVSPRSRFVQVHRQDGTGRRLQVGDVLDGGDVLPGFRCEVASILE